MRRREEGRGNGDIHFAAVGRNMVDGTALRGDVHTVEAHAQARNKTRAEDSHARESLRGSKCGLGNQRVGNAPDDTGPGPRARNDHLRNMSRLQRSSGSRSSQVNHVKGATAGHEDKSLVRGRVDGDTSEKRERARGAVLHRKRSCTSAIQSDLALEILLVRRGYRIRDAGLRRRSRLDHESDRKSTRLNSSHQIISYAVFCLKKKKIIKCNKANNTAPRSGV